MSEDSTPHFFSQERAVIDEATRTNGVQGPAATIIPVVPGANGQPRERPPTIGATTAPTNATGKRLRADEEELEANTKRRRVDSRNHGHDRNGQRGDSRNGYPADSHRYDDGRRNDPRNHRDNYDRPIAPMRHYRQDQRPSTLGPTDGYDVGYHPYDREAAPRSRQDARPESSRFRRDDVNLQRRATTGASFASQVLPRLGAVDLDKAGSGAASRSAQPRSIDPQLPSGSTGNVSNITARPNQSGGLSGHQTDPRKMNRKEQFVPGQIYFAAHHAVAFDPRADPSKNSNFLQGKFALLTQKNRPFVCASMTNDVGVQGFPISTGSKLGISKQPAWKRKYLIPLGLRSDDEPPMEGSLHKPVAVQMFDGKKMSPDSFVDISQSYPTAYFEDTKIVGAVEKTDAIWLMTQHQKITREAEDEAWDRHTKRRQPS